MPAKQLSQLVGENPSVFRSHRHLGGRGYLPHALSDVTARHFRIPPSRFHVLAKP